MSNPSGKTPIRILHLEDDSLDHKLMAKALAVEGLACDWTYAKTQKEFLVALQAGDFDIILSDFTLPSYGGMEALAAARHEKSELPFIFVSGTIGEERAVASLKLGATDYVLKDNLKHLGFAVRRALWQAQLHRAKLEAERELLSTHAELRQLLEHSPAVIYRLRIEGENLVPTMVSDNIERLLGFSVAEALSYQWWLESLHPDDRERVIGVVTQGVKRQGYTTEYRLRHKDGTYRWIQDDNRVVEHPTGQHKEAIGVWIDITERKSLQNEIVLREQRLNSFFAGSTAGLVLLSKDFRYIQINETLAQMNGVPVEDHLGRTLRDILPQVAALVEPLLRRVLLTGKPVLNEEIAGETAGRPGQMRYWAESFFPVGGKDGTPEMIGGVVVEITERKQLEQQLYQAQKMDAIGQLAGGVAHDFNNLLAVIYGNSELALTGTEAVPAEARECLKQINAAAERAAILTRQLLTFSRKQAMQSAPVLLNELLANLLKMLNRIIGENIELKCRYDKDLPLVQADPGMIEQVLLNLVVNARDAMAKGGRLEIATESIFLDEAAARQNPEARAGHFVCFTVSDNGTGIAPDHLPRIFEPFFTSKEIGKGTGLGLATVYGIVKQHRGWIEVSSQLGAGTSFRVALPALPSAPRRDVSPPMGQALRGGSETILLVEDEVTVRTVTRRALEAYGYKIYEASSAQEALEIWAGKSNKIALLLTDIIMRESTTGLELAVQLHAQCPTLKVIYMSGYSPEFAGKASGPQRREKGQLLQKPFTMRALLEAVRHGLDEK
jgi:two-component system, cell cycle sensor histidine kinase and response regulator CckA